MYYNVPQITLSAIFKNTTNHKLYCNRWVAYIKIAQLSCVRDHYGVFFGMWQTPTPAFSHAQCYNLGMAEREECSLERGLSELEQLEWKASVYEGVSVADISHLLDPTEEYIPLPTLMGVKLEPHATLPPHWHKRGQNWLEKIEIFEGEYTVLGFAEEQHNGPQTIFNDHLEIFGIRNESDQPLYFTSYMYPAYTGPEENRPFNEWW